METTSQYLISYTSHRATADYTPLDNLHICTDGRMIKTYYGVLSTTVIILLPVKINRYATH